MKVKYLVAFLIFLGLNACEDQIDIIKVPDGLDSLEVRITRSIDSIEVGRDFQFEASVFRSGQLSLTDNVNWVSSDISLLTIDTSGNADALKEGRVDIFATVDSDSSTAIQVVIFEKGSGPSEKFFKREGVFRGTNDYNVSGSCILKETKEGLVLETLDNFNSQSGPDLHMYLANDPNSSFGVVNLGEMSGDQFSGAHQYKIPESVSIGTFNYVVVWCELAGQGFGFAELNSAILQ